MLFRSNNGEQTFVEFVMGTLVVTIEQDGQVFGFARRFATQLTEVDGFLDKLWSSFVNFVRGLIRQHLLILWIIQLNRVSVLSEARLNRLSHLQLLLKQVSGSLLFDRNHV